MYKTVQLKDAPELKRLILAADPTYKKRACTLWVGTDVRLSQTYWDGGTRFTYTAVNLDTCKVGAAPQYNPPQFGGPAQDPRVQIPRRACIVKTGVFCGKTAQASITMHPDDVTPFLPKE